MKPPLLHLLGKNIRRLRTAQGVPPEEFAEMAKMSAEDLQRIEDGELEPNYHGLVDLRDALDVDWNTMMPSPRAETCWSMLRRTRKALA